MNFNGRQISLIISVVDEFDGLPLILECKNADGILLIFDINDIYAIKSLIKRRPIFEEVKKIENNEIKKKNKN